METAAQPSPPTPDDFQITAADIAVFDERQRRLESLKPKLSFALSAAVIALIGLLQTDWKSVVSDGFLSASTYIELLLMLLGWCFFSLIGTIFTALLLINPLIKFVLSRTPHAGAIRRYNAAVAGFRAWLARTRRDWWTGLSGLRFEEELARLFRAAGWDARVTRASGDGGIDILGSRAGVKFIAQCKNHKLPIGPAVARELYGTLLSSEAQHAILASVSGFTKGVRDFAKGKPIELIDLDWIIRKHMEHDVSWKSLVSPTTERKSRIRIRLRRSI